jgi:hypothetical protein
VISADSFSPGLSRQNFRTGLAKLVDLKYIKIISNGKKFLEREKSTIKLTINSHLVNLCSSGIYDIKCYTGNQATNQRLTINKKDKKYKKDHPSIPSLANGPETRDDLMMIDDPCPSPKVEIIPGVLVSQEVYAECVKIKGTSESVKHAVEYIQNSKTRKHAIIDWPNALRSWKIKIPVETRMSQNLALAEEACKVFNTFDRGHGWRCELHYDKVKDQRGIIFQPQSGYLKPLFVAFSDSEYRDKCRRIVLENNMERKK